MTFNIDICFLDYSLCVFRFIRDYHDVHTAQKKYNEIKSDCVSDHTDKTTGKHIREINWNKLEKKK